MDGWYKLLFSSLSRSILRELDCPPRHSQNQFHGRCTQSLLHRDIMHQIRPQLVSFISSKTADNFRVIFRRFVIARLGYGERFTHFKAKLTGSLSVETIGTSRRNVNTRLEGSPPSIVFIQLMVHNSVRRTCLRRVENVDQIKSSSESELACMDQSKSLLDS
ncbi:hypothetical protein AVEN_65515-1 [Araneus ventricosus]|uniref:Uncharacterized protein n=1 Tax=Araneus ventricosus TaxID=182803 RepID=A0A4Y2FIS6_ARAVE|nr:hypothetical protein AVEN_65515-1 [Araneus ventricosus]